MPDIPSSAWWLVAIAVIAGWALRSSRLKGLLGELYLRFAAWWGLNGAEYHRLHNVMLRTPDGATQIDHVFISRFGVFVVETKHIRGWMFGREGDRQWTQVVNGEKWHFQNPLRQNYKHVKAVESALSVEPSAIHSVIVFTARATFKTAMPRHVTLGRKFVSYIKSFREAILTEEEVAGLVSELHRSNLSRTNILRVRHIKLLRQRGRPGAHWRCPKCGKPMVIRTARRGRRVGSKFWACSGYPECEYTRNTS